MTPMFDDPDTAAREAFSAAAVILGDRPAYAKYLGWSPAEVAALATHAASWRTTAPPMLRRLAAAQLSQQVAAYAQFLVQVTRVACVQFAPGDQQAERDASAIAATITRFAPVSNSQLEPAPAPDEQVEDLGQALDDLEHYLANAQGRPDIAAIAERVRSLRNNP